MERKKEEELWMNSGLLVNASTRLLGTLYRTCVYGGSVYDRRIEWMVDREGKLFEAKSAGKWA